MGLAVLQPGTRIGLFEVLGTLGVGGMGEVYRARDARLQRDVAIKVLPEQLTHDPDRRARFEREARLLATLNHPHIASIYGLEDAGGQVALVLELVDGPTLADRLAGGAFSSGESLRIAGQIAGALEAAHEKRIIHRDLKPENVKLTPGGGVKLLDFGIAKALAPDDPGDASQATATASTRDGTIVGTAAYMSPEQARGQQVDKRTDIWAFGCVLYEMLSGRRAFGGPTLSDAFAALLEREPDWTALPAGTPPPSSLVKIDPAQDEVRLYWPWFLPGGSRTLYVAITDGGSSVLKMIETGQAPRSIMRVGSNVQWVDPDYLVFAREGTLLAQRVDPAGGRPVGEPVAIADPVDYSYIPPRAAFAASRTGTLVYQSHRDAAELAWFDRSGKQVGTVREPASYYTLRLSIDGTQLMFVLRDRRQGTQDVWMRDLVRGIETPLSSDPRPELPGPWLPDRRSIVFSAVRSGAPEIFLKNLVTGEERSLLSAGAFQMAGDVTPDGRHLIYTQRADDWDIWMMPLDRPSEAAPLLNRPFAETDPRLSPDGRALAFVTNESKRPNVYVTAFPVTGARVQVSTDGGTQPRWGPGGELFFISGQGQLMSVPVRTASSLDVGTPRPVFPLPDRGWADFAVAPDGRFLAVVPEITAREQPVTVIVNWPAAIKR